MARIEGGNNGDPTRVSLTSEDIRALEATGKVLAQQGKVMTGYTIREARTGRVIAVQLSPKAQASMNQAELDKMALDD